MPHCNILGHDERLECLIKKSHHSINCANVCYVPSIPHPLLPRSQIASDAGVAKTMLATLAIKGKRGAFTFHQLSTSHDIPSGIVIDSFIHASFAS